MEPEVTFNGREVTKPLPRGILLVAIPLTMLTFVIVATLIPVAAIVLLIVILAPFVPVFVVCVVAIAAMIILAKPCIYIFDRILKAQGRRGFIDHDGYRLALEIGSDSFRKIS